MQKQEYLGVSTAFQTTALICVCQDQHTIISKVGLEALPVRRSCWIFPPQGWALDHDSPPARLRF